MTRSLFNALSGVSVLAMMVATGMGSAANAQSSGDAASAQAPGQQAEQVVVTGSRIPRSDETASSPVVSTDREEIQLENAMTVEDFSTKLPQAAGGVRDTAEGSDSFGAEVFDLRNLGQSRTLVLIDGTRAVPFSIRNSVDVGSIPASLIKRVDVLTGGAAAVYGADAVAGVVNFIMNDDFDGAEFSAKDKTAQHGGSEYGGSLTLGGGIGDRGHIVLALDYTQQDEVKAGTRSWAATPGATQAPIGGNFTDVASGRAFSFTSDGAFTTTPQTSNFSSQFPLIEPLKRFNVASFLKYNLTDNVELYGRVMYTNARTEESGTPGPNPASVSQVVSINQNNPFLTPQIASQLTFVGGAAQVQVNKTLGLGLIDFHTERNTTQFQLGLRGPITNAIRWDAYSQYGRVTENSPITGDGLVTNAAGVNNFAAIANTANIFGPNETSLASLGSTIPGNDRTRDQLVSSASISGDSSDLFSLPAGPIGFAVGYEYRQESTQIIQDSALQSGNTYREGALAAYSGAFSSNEGYGEVLVPVVKDWFLAKEVDLGAAYRYSSFSQFGNHDTHKWEVTWVVNDDIRFRGTAQSVIRTPNFSEYAATESSIPFNNLVTVARLAPRYAGDPCVLGTGNAAQCARFGAPAVGSTNSFAPSYLEGNYVFGGNAAVQPETGKTKTLGVVLTPDFVPRLSTTVDYYDIDLNGAIGVIQPVSDLTSCYITNPTAGNPLCQLVTRDPANGHLLNALVNNQNLGVIDQRGIDVGMKYSIPVPIWMPGDDLLLSYQGTFVTHYTIQSNSTVPAVNCAGTFGATCSSDATTLVQPAYRHNITLGWQFDWGQVELDWQRIGAVRDSAPGATDVIPDQDYFDINSSYQVTKWLALNAGIHNLFDKDPPIVAPTSTNGGFNTFPDTYDLYGRVFSFSVTLRPE
jgi:iron complex outermembrane recepter protein